VIEAEGHLFHRLIKQEQPHLDDFLSNDAKGHPPPDDPIKRAAWDGISAYRTLAQARRKRRTSPILGTFIAVIRVLPDDPITAERSFGPGHFTLRGAPHLLLSRVVSVEPV
jgi:hypothetical protein